MFFSLCLLMGLILSGTSGFLEQLEKPEVREIKARLEEEKAKRLLLQNDVEMLILKVAQLERKYDDDATKTSHGVTYKQDSGKIAFTARLTTATTLDLHHVVKFDQILHNHGNGYSSNTGVFKAPFNGTFVFSLSALSKATNIYFHISIMKNAMEIGRIFSGSTVNAWHDQGSVTVVTSLSENDEVFVWEFAASGALHGDLYCSFTGFEV